MGCGITKRGYVPQPVEKPEPVALAKGQERSLMPLSRDSVWTYKLTTEIYRDGELVGSGDQIVTYVVLKSEKSGDRTTATLELRSGDKVIDRQEMYQDATGLFQTTVGINPIVKFSPPQPILLSPVDEHKEFSYKGMGLKPDGKAGAFSSKSSIHESQSVDTDQGAFSAIPIETTINYGPESTKPGHNVTFFRPGLGIVRFRQETSSGRQLVVTTLRLKNYAIKPQ